MQARSAAAINLPLQTPASRKTINAEKGTAENASQSEKFRSL